MLAEHMQLQVGDIIRFPQNDNNQLFDCADGDGLRGGDLLYRHILVVYPDGWYLTGGYWPHDGKRDKWDIRELSQSYIDRFAKKVVRG